MENLDISVWDIEEAGGIIIDDSKMMDCETPPSDPDFERDEGGYTVDDNGYNYNYTEDEEKEIKHAIKRARCDIEYILKRHPFGHHKADVLMKLITYLEKDIHNIEYLDIFDNNVQRKRKRV